MGSDVGALTALTELSLFSGAGGGVLASRMLGHRVVCYVEHDAYCQAVLQRRIADGAFDDAPIWDDVRTFDGHPWAGLVDIISAGFPCQPFSVAGSRQGGADLRNGWPDTCRIVREVRPRYAFLENVPGLIAGAHGYFGTVLADLAALGYDTEWTCLSAAAVGAPHRRNRVWILATDADGDRARQQSRRGGGADGQGASLAGIDGEAGASADASVPRRSRRDGPERAPTKQPRACRGDRDVADADRARQLQPQGCVAEFRRRVADGGWWASEPNVGRVADGVASRSHRLRALGNGQVPQCALAAWRGLMGRVSA